MRFIGRKSEIKALKGLLEKETPSLVVIRGRRRIGKSRLAEEFSSSFSNVYSLSGIPPHSSVSAEMQRAEFLRQLQTYKLPAYDSGDWGTLFHTLAKSSQKGRVLIILDEITWMGSQDPTFLPKLKTAWDLYFKKNPQLVLIISGSNSAWIERNILSSTGFFGRVSLRMLLKELPLNDCDLFWKKAPGKISVYEKFKMLSVTGGVPRYLEELRHDLTAEQNICQLCFHSEGLLFHEFNQIFHDLFRSRGAYYQQILKEIGGKHLSAKEIATVMGRSLGGDLTEALDTLIQAGFLARDYTWSLSTGKNSKLSRYRIRDNYTRFYIKYIDPIRDKIESAPLKSPPSGWHGMMGLQFENLVINNGALIQNILGISGDDIVNAGPFLQTPQTRRKGCQIDYLIQTRFHTLYLCEIKFQAGLITQSVIEELEKKLAALKVPKRTSIKPILIHINGVCESIRDSGAFAKIIDFGEFLSF